MKVSRRTAIKSIGAGVAAATLPGIAQSFQAATTHNTDALRVQIAHQWGKDSIAAVIKNTSTHPTTLTDISSVSADYGRFNFSDLTRNGPLTLAAGEEVHVPFTVMGTPVKPYGHFDNRLQKKLKESLSISTANRSVNVTTSLTPVVV